MTESNAVGVVILVPIIVGILEVLKRTGLPSRFIPLTSLLIGVAAGVIDAATRPGATPQSISVGVLQGAILGLSAVGLYSGTQATMGR